MFKVQSKRYIFVQANRETVNYMIYYHGTSNSQIKDKVLPPSLTGCISEVGRKKNLDQVFFTTSYKSALIYAKRAANQYGGIARVLEVEPIGEICCLNANAGTEVYHSNYCIVKQ